MHFLESQIHFFKIAAIIQFHADYVIMAENNGSRDLEIKWTHQLLALNDHTNIAEDIIILMIRNTEALLNICKSICDCGRSFIAKIH